MGKIFITAATTLLGAVLLQQRVEIPGVDMPTLGTYWAVPLIIIAVMSYIIASIFTTLYEMAIDTIFLSFCMIWLRVVVVMVLQYCS